MAEETNPKGIEHDPKYVDANGRPTRAYWEERLPELRRQTRKGIENLRRIGEGLPPKP